MYFTTGYGEVVSGGLVCAYRGLRTFVLSCEFRSSVSACRLGLAHGGLTYKKTARLRDVCLGACCSNNSERWSSGSDLKPPASMLLATREGPRRRQSAAVNGLIVPTDPRAYYLSCDKQRRRRVPRGPKACRQYSAGPTKCGRARVSRPCSQSASKSVRFRGASKAVK